MIGNPTMAMDKPGLTERAYELLTALRMVGGWLSRSQLAKIAGGKKTLSPHDVNLLQRLIDEGFVEIRQRPSRVPGRIAYDYHAIPGKE